MKNSQLGLLIKENSLTDLKNNELRKYQREDVRCQMQEARGKMADLDAQLLQFITHNL
ncbi:hypothetical protein D3C85_851330 [compost metagenome]